MGQLKTKPDDPLKTEKKTKWWMPLFGLVLAVVLAVMAFMVAPILRGVWWGFAPQLRASNKVMIPADLAGGACNRNALECWGTVDLGLAFIIWLLVFAIAMFIVIAATGGETEKEKMTKEMLVEMKKKKEMQQRMKKRGVRQKTYKKK